MKHLSHQSSKKQLRTKTTIAIVMIVLFVLLGWINNNNNGIVMVVTAQQSGNNTSSTSGIQTTSYQPNSLLDIRIETNSFEEIITFELTLTGLLTWLSIGFSTTGQMIGSTAVIGLIPSATSGSSGSAEQQQEGTVQKYDMTSKIESGVTPVTSDTIQSTLTDKIFVQNGTHTYMKFTRPLVDNGSPEIFISNDTKNIFLWGYGYDDNVLRTHQERGSFEIILKPNNDDGSGGSNVQAIQSPNKTLWLVHGICMCVAWVILIPLGIGASRLRTMLKSGTMWFTIHRIFNIIGVVLTMIGFVVAIIATNRGGTNHFTTNQHQKLGLSVSVLAIVQALNGLLRPHVANAAATTTTTTKTTDVGTNNNNNQARTSSDDGNNELVSASGGNNKNDDEFYDNEEDNNLNKVLSSPTTATTTPVPIKSTQRTAWEIMHRIVGVAVLIVALINCYSGIDQYDIRYDFDYSLVLSIVIGIIFGILFVLQVYLFLCTK